MADSPAASALTRRLTAAQRDRRLPAVSAAVWRGAAQLWAGQVHAQPAQQFRIGSITKTFTAVLVAQCRDAGLLDFDDPAGEHLDLPLPQAVTIRRLLSHGAGVQREPAGDVWAGGELPDVEHLLARAATTEQVLAPGRRFHYSNLGYALLGQIVARRRGLSWQRALDRHLLDPLGLTGITDEARPGHAQGRFVRPYSDEAVAEPPTDMRGLAPAAQLWAAASELARWGVFLVAPEPAVLLPATAAELAEVAVMADVQRWGLAFGLGLMLYRRGDRVLIGHGGAMPGFLAGLVVDPASATAAVVLTAAGAGADAEVLAAELVEDALEHDPPPVAPWQPAPAPPAEVAGLLGRWWTEGNEVVFSWHGRLEARLAVAPAWREPAVFEPLSPADGVERWRTVSGRECGELLRVARTAGGQVQGMWWATYALTREPAAFAELAAPTDAGGAPTPAPTDT